LSFLHSEALTSEQVDHILAVLEERRLARGVALAKPGSEPFLDFLHRFWDYDQSPYVEEKRTHGHRIGNPETVNVKYCGDTSCERRIRGMRRFHENSLFVTDKLCEWYCFHLTDPNQRSTPTPTPIRW
jgi:hypothetical protein